MQNTEEICARLQKILSNSTEMSLTSFTRGLSYHIHLSCPSFVLMINTNKNMSWHFWRNYNCLYIFFCCHHRLHLKFQQKSIKTSVRPDWLYGISVECCVFYYYLWIVCDTSYISVKFVLNLCICICIHFFPSLVSLLCITAHHGGSKMIFDKVIWLVE